MILNTVLDITRETGFETVNAQSIASKLQCSTRPIFTCYKNMDELKKEFLEFAREETHLFKLLFISDIDLEHGKNITQSPPPVKRVARDAGLEPTLFGSVSRRWLLTRCCP